ncbi:MAG TPA: hypothetical protein VMP67_05395 [Candidatus Limnocylindria bacterium]|nr:hypothetical protein [Candidatus Limnocylindria bacterium]
MSGVPNPDSGGDQDRPRPKARRGSAEARPPEPESLGQRLQALPAWLQAVAAVAGVLLTALIAFGILRNPDGPPPPPPPPATADARPLVSLESVVSGQGEVRGSGAYQNLDPETQGVLFIGQPVDASGADWLPVVANLATDGVASSGPRNGRWEAVRPGVPSEPYRWYAVVAPASAGAGDVYEDLRANGPESEFVLAASDEQATD